MIVEVRHTVTRLDLTAAQWQLYTSMEGVDHAVVAMNRDVRDAINTVTERGGDRAEARAKATEVLQRFSKYGAMDTEPRYVLLDVLDKVFGNNGKLDE